MKFTKMHGAGNDYIYFDCLDTGEACGLADPRQLSVRLSDRHYGIGGDGIVLICPSNVADLKMRMFNADGSEGKMCGNAIRCVAKYAYDRGIVKRDLMHVETLSGIKEIKIFSEKGKVFRATVNMGPAAGLKSEEIRIPQGQGAFLIDHPLDVNGVQWHVTTVSMGNPHCVVFVPDLSDLNLQEIGPGFEKHQAFPQQINTEFIKVINPTTLEMRVWERGSGETLACGTGACAAVTAAIWNGFCEKETDVTVRLAGGDLTIRVTDETVFMTGDAVEVFSGEIDLKDAKEGKINENQ